MSLIASDVAGWRGGNGKKHSKGLCSFFILIEEEEMQKGTLVKIPHHCHAEQWGLTSLTFQKNFCCLFCSPSCTLV